MKSWDFDAVTFNGEVFCIGCLPQGISADSEGVMPIFADSEWDYYPVCSVCHGQHYYVALTSDGQRYEWARTLPETLRSILTSENELPAYTLLGGYPLTYITDDGQTICPKCANKTDTSDPPIAADVNWEDSELYCDDCGERIESAYAED